MGLDDIKKRTMQRLKEKKRKEKEERRRILSQCIPKTDGSGNKKITESTPNQPESTPEATTNQPEPESEPKPENKKINYDEEDWDSANDPVGFADNDSDDSLIGDEEYKKKHVVNRNHVIPYLYIDYDEKNIQIAKDIGYRTIQVKRNEGLTRIQVETAEKECERETYIIINCWKVLTRSNMNIFSFDCKETDPKKFRQKIEDKIKWGSKPYIKERLTKEEQQHFSPFRNQSIYLLKRLKTNFHTKIFIVSNSNYSFVKKFFEYYKIDDLVEEYFTPSRCGMPSGRLMLNNDSYNDRRKINKARVFACIERYVGRLPIWRTIH